MVHVQDPSWLLSGGQHFTNQLYILLKITFCFQGLRFEYIQIWYEKEKNIPFIYFLIFFIFFKISFLITSLPFSSSSVQTELRRNSI